MVKRVPPSVETGATAQSRDRMHLRVARDVKELLEQAAAISTGGDVTAFVIGAATERARHVLNDLEVTRLDDESRQRFYSLVLDPPEPTRALKKLLALETFRVVE